MRAIRRKVPVLGLLAVLAIVVILLVPVGAGTSPRTVPSSSPTSVREVARDGSGEALRSEAPDATPLAIGASAWNPLSPSGTVPSPRYDAGVASLELGNGDPILFGGISASGTYLNDFWEYTTSSGVGSWTNSSYTTEPPARAHAGLAYDAEYTGEGTYLNPILFGGTSPTGTYLNDSYIDEGGWEPSTDWGQFPPAVASDPLMATMYSGNVLVLVVDTSCWCVATWEVDWQFWTQLHPALEPPRDLVENGSLVLDTADGAMLLIGPDGGQTETWEFAEGQWSELATTSAPPTDLGFAVSDDPAAQGVLLFGGPTGCAQPCGQTWLLRNGTWENLTSIVGTAPSGRQGEALTLLPSGRSPLLFGGTTGTGALDDNWNFSTGSWGPFQLSAKAVPLSGFTPLPVVFNGTASGGYPPYSFQWSFSVNSYEDIPGANLSLTFQDPGTPTETLTAYDSHGEMLQTIVDLTIAPGPIQITLGATVTSGPAPLTTYLTSSVTGGTPGSDDSYTDAWNLGDGAMASSADVQHTYTEPGTYDVNFTATDSVRVSATKWVTIQVAPPTLSANWTELSPASSPSARYDPSMTYDVADGEMVLFGGAIPLANNAWHYLDDTWVYKNGDWTNITSTLLVSPSARAGAPMVYDAADGYVLLVGASDATEPWGSALDNDTWAFSGGQWTEMAPFPWTPTAWLEMTYDASAGYVVFSAQCEQGDGVWSYLADHWTLLSRQDPGIEWDPLAYDSTDGYDLQLGGNGSYTTWTLSGRSWTERPPSALPTWRGAQPLLNDPVAQRVLLIDVDPTSYAYSVRCQGSYCFDTWGYVGGNWTDLTTLTNYTPPERFNPAIAYDPATGTILMFGGATSTTSGPLADTWQYTISPVSSPLAVTASASPATGPAPFTTSFSAVVTGGSPPDSYLWSFGDGSFDSTQANPTHTYTSGGTYVVTLKVTDSTGAVASYDLTLLVTLGVPLSLAISAAPTRGAAPLTVDFTSAVVGGYGTFSIYWTFGQDEGSSQAWDPTHTYNLSGVFEVEAWVDDSAGGSATQFANITVTSPGVPGPLSVAAAAAPQSGTAPLLVAFSGDAGGGAPPYTYRWDFGDGSRGSSALGPVHTFNVSGSYVAVLTVTDSDGEVAEAHVGINVSAATVAPHSSSPGISATLLEEVAVAGVVVVALAAFLLATGTHRRRGSGPLPSAKTETGPASKGPTPTDPAPDGHVPNEPTPPGEGASPPA